MNTTQLNLPLREAKPRTNGITVLIDGGVPVRYFEDVMESSNEFVDYVKFGWGTSVVTSQLERKIDCLRRHDIRFFFGGTLFEKFYSQGKVEEYKSYCRNYGCTHVEISNGTVNLSNRDKAKYVEEFAKEFTVFSEVGYKDSDRSLNLHPARWIEFMEQDLSAGADKVITEARESGTSGICRSNGEVRFGLIEEILDSRLDSASIIFEAPNKELQNFFVHKVGTNVNLANVPFQDVIPLETLRLGLRSDTLQLFAEGADLR